MTTFAILNRNSDQDLSRILMEKYPDAHVWSPQVAFVRDANNATGVSEKLGIRTKAPSGEFAGNFTQMVVIEVAPDYWGFTETSLWSWLKASFEATG